MTSLKDLPCELLTEICQSSTSSALRNLRLINKHLAAVARPLLFKDGVVVQLQNPNDTRSSYLYGYSFLSAPINHHFSTTKLTVNVSKWGSKWFDSAEPESQAEGCLNEIAAEMRQITLNFEETPKRLSRRAIAMIQAPKNLEVLRIVGQPLPEDCSFESFNYMRLAELSIQHFAQLHTLDLRRIDVIKDEFWDFLLRHSKSLRNLHVSVIDLPVTAITSRLSRIMPQLFLTEIVLEIELSVWYTTNALSVVSSSLPSGSLSVENVGGGTPHGHAVLRWVRGWNDTLDKAVQVSSIEF